MTRISWREGLLEREGHNNCPGAAGQTYPHTAFSPCSQNEQRSSATETRLLQDHARSLGLTCSAPCSVVNSMKAKRMALLGSPHTRTSTSWPQSRKKPASCASVQLSLMSLM